MDAINIMPNGLLCKHFHELNFPDWRSILENRENFAPQKIAAIWLTLVSQELYREAAPSYY